MAYLETNRDVHTVASRPGLLSGFSGPNDPMSREPLRTQPS